MFYKAHKNFPEHNVQLKISGSHGGDRSDDGGSKHL
jgi:hypothetical protein